MKPVDFEQSNCTYKGNKDVQDLHVFRNNEEVIACFKLSFLERLRLLFTGKIWYRQLGHNVSPMLLDVKCPFEYVPE